MTNWNQNDIIQIATINTVTNKHWNQLFFIHFDEWTKPRHFLGGFVTMIHLGIWILATQFIRRCWLNSIAPVLSLQHGLCNPARNSSLVWIVTTLAAAKLLGIEVPKRLLQWSPNQRCIQKGCCNKLLILESNSCAAGHCCAAAMAERPDHNMPRSAARQTMRFSIVQVAWEAVRLLLLDFPRILFLNGCWGHACWELDGFAVALSKVNV